MPHGRWQKLPRFALSSPLIIPAAAANSPSYYVFQGAGAGYLRIECNLFASRSGVRHYVTSERQVSREVPLPRNRPRYYVIKFNGELQYERRAENVTGIFVENYILSPIFTFP